MIWLALLLAQSAVTTPSQIDRGEALFLESPGGCATCHALKGKGTAIGPDLKGVARLSPAGLAMAIRSTVTQYVQTVKTKADGSFPAMPPAGDQATAQIYDLSKMPPAPHSVEKGSYSMSPNNGWKHPPSVRKFTDEQVADLIAYIRYAGAGIKTPVDPNDVK